MFRTLLQSLLALLLRPLQWADNYKRNKHLAKKAKKNIDPWSYWSDDKRAQVWASNMLILKQYTCAVIGGTAAIIARESIDFLHILQWHTASSNPLLQIFLLLAAILCCLWAIAIAVGGSVIFIKLTFFSGFRWQVRSMMRSLPDDFDFSKLNESDKARLHTLLEWKGVLSARQRTNKLLLESLIQSYSRKDEITRDDALVSQSS